MGVSVWGGGGGGCVGGRSFLTKTWVFEKSKIQLSTGKRKKEKKQNKKKKQKKMPGRVRNGTCLRKTILGPDWSSSTTEISLFLTLRFLPIFGQSQGDKKRKKNTEKYK